MALPFIDITAPTHQEAFYQLGKKLRAKILRRNNIRRQIFGTKYTYLCRVATAWYRLVEKTYPLYFQELKSLAQGANCPTKEILLANCSDIFDTKTTNHCSSVVVKIGQHYYLAHNEDESSPDYQHDAYRYYLKIKEDQSCYQGLGMCRSLIGASVSISNHLVQFVNTLTPTQVTAGIPRNIISRLILDCQTPSEVKQQLTSLKRASSYHHTLFFYRLNKKYSLEYAQNQLCLRLIKNNFFHTNHFITYLKKKNNYTSPSSLIRYAMIKKNINTIKRLDDLKKLMANSEKEPNGISRPQTIYSVIIKDNLKNNLFSPHRPVKIEDYEKWTLK